MNKHLTILHILVLSVISQFAQADIFQYTDDKGTVIMVDEESKIPKKYRKKSRTTRSESDSGARSAGAAGRSGRVMINSEGK